MYKSMWDQIELIRPKILKYITSRNVHDQDREDVFQEACFKILSKNDIAVKNLEAMLVSYTKNCIYDIYKDYTKKNLHSNIEEEHNKQVLPKQFLDYNTPESLLLQEKDINYTKRLQNKRAYRRLSPRNKKVIYLKFVKATLEKDIAKRLNISVGAVEMVVLRFKRAFNND